MLFANFLQNVTKPLLDLWLPVNTLTFLVGTTLIALSACKLFSSFIEVSDNRTSHFSNENLVWTWWACISSYIHTEKYMDSECILIFLYNNLHSYIYCAAIDLLKAYEKINY